VITRGAFGDYELLEEIARGGMGVVYKARQVSLDRLVAVKMILAGESATPAFVQRFRTEASAAALLRHPNIVAIHEVGVHAGQHYFSTDFVDGPSLAALVGHVPLPARRAAQYVKTIAEAIHYAHQQGILHRDLKPSNVLIDANDQPHITDFGLAKRLEGETSLMLSGQMVGSPNFMPPEQATARHGKVGRYSDVYALGGDPLPPPDGPPAVPGGLVGGHRQSGADGRADFAADAQPGGAAGPGDDLFEVPGEGTLAPLCDCPGAGG
jgi:serine/threonine-protein kinase